MKSLLPLVRRRDWDGVQSLWVLPAARRLYLVGAITAVAAALLALAIAVVFQVLSLIGAKTESVPEAGPVAMQQVDLASLDQLFAGPSNVRATPEQLGRPVRPGMVVARLDADSRVGLAGYPGGLQIIGGRDAELVREEASPYSRGDTVLVATERYAAMLNAMAAGRSALPEIQLRILATDRNGTAAAPAVITFTPSFTAPTAGAPETTNEDIGGPEALRKIAIILANIAAQRGTPEWFDAFEYAMGQPGRCGVDADANDMFIAEYGRSVRHVRAKLTRSSLPMFYRGMCDAWAEQVEAAKRAELEAQAERAAAIARNLAAEATAAVAQESSRMARNTAIMFAAAAISFFMMVALFLAFLAIEGHSNAVRDAIQILARHRKDGDAKDD